MPRMLNLIKVEAGISLVIGIWITVGIGGLAELSPLNILQVMRSSEMYVFPSDSWQLI